MTGSRARPTPPREGAALPIVLLLLAVFAAMGIAFLSAGRGGYRQMAMSADRLKLEELVVSALDEARYRVYQQSTLIGLLRNQPGAVEPELRAKLLEEIFNSADDLSQMEVRYDLTRALDWTTAMAQVTDPDFGFEKIEAHFYGFRPIVFSDDGRFPGSNEVSKQIDYYQNLEPFQDDADPADPSQRWRWDYPIDLQGYCTLSVHARLGGMERQISVTHDVKLVDAKPPAREFALFSWRSPKGDKDRIFNALNEGDGKLIMYPQVVGRMHVRGPYVLLTEGHADGTGGNRPRPSATSPRERAVWSEWSQVPTNRAMRLRWGLLNVSPKTARPLKPCIDCDDGMALTFFGSGGSLSFAGDHAIFGMDQPYFTAPVPHGHQRFFLNGEPHAKDPTRDENSVQGLGPDAFTGPMLRFTPDPDEEGMTTVSGHVFTQEADWTRPGEDGDVLRVEPGVHEGLYSPYKMYLYKREGCPRPGVTWNPLSWFRRGASYVRSAFCFTAEVASFGSIQAGPYKREPREPAEGIPSPDQGTIRDLAELPFGVRQSADPDVLYEPQIFLNEFGFQYEVEETLSAWSSVLNVGVNIVSAVLMVALPGPGTAAGTGLRVAFRGGMNAGLRNAARLTTRAVVNPKTLGVLSTDLVGAGVQTQLDPNVTQGGASQASTIPSSWVTPPADGNPDDFQAPDPVAPVDIDYTFDMIIGEHQQTASREKESIDKGSEVLYQLMTGDHTEPAVNSMDDLITWRDREALDLVSPEAQDRPILYRGFLPPDLKSYMRLSTAVYDELGDATATVGERRLELDGVISVNRLPQEEDNHVADLRYVGRGILFSYSKGDPDKQEDPNNEPVIGGNILPMSRGRDYMTMVYWSGADPAVATQGNGLGMLGLTQPRNEASFVSPYGVRPKGEYTTIRGNLVTGFLDRNRFETGNDLRVFYDWQNLAPEKAEEDPQAAEQAKLPPDAFVSLVVSPKVAGWYDAIR